jgi:hypothetical protein
MRIPIAENDTAAQREPVRSTVDETPIAGDADEPHERPKRRDST